MFVIFFQFSPKPGYSDKDVMKLYNESAISMYRSCPGCISFELMKYIPDGTGTIRWDYATMEVWESEEHRKKAEEEKKIGIQDSELADTGFYTKFGEMMDKWYGYSYNAGDDTNLFTKG
ncbi:hypothetical protein GF312_02790 [Candidatus Poribacteria bacterium]|nr:hypothetical protein [Candidatus Poribacteria bacterium]